MEERYQEYNKNILTRTRTQHRETLERSEDYILPDYISDIKKLVRCVSEAKVHNLFNNGSTLACEGEVIHNILVICEDDSIKNVIYSDSFSVNIASRDNDDNDTYLYVRTENPVCRLLSPRRLNCKCRINIFTQNEENEDTSPSFKADITEDDREGLECKNAVLNTMVSKTVRETGYHASHDIELASSMPEIAGIVCCDLSISINDIKCIDSRTALRGEVTVSIIYESVDSGYRYLKRTLPYSEFVSREMSVNAFCLYSVEPKDIKLTVANNNFGEMKLLELDYSYDIEHKYFENRECGYTEDVYSVNKSCEYQSDTLEYTRLIEGIGGKISICEQLPIPDYEDHRPVECLESYARVISCEAVCEGNICRYEGVMRVECICADEKESYSCFTFDIPFKTEKELCEAPSSFEEEHRITVASRECNIDGDCMRISAELCLDAAVSTKESRSRVSVISLGEEWDNGHSAVLCYPKEGDTLWDIAKRYRKRASDIIRYNDLVSDDLDTVKVLLIKN
ncbi:MAG: DUF3794 domain-containing protein [Ruminococcaceae bacterium]|nr:DUF3794 domain-containing protein [Oscillospiraceae bacterium]